MLAKWTRHNSGLAILSGVLILLVIATFAFSYHVKNSVLADDAMGVVQGRVLHGLLSQVGAKDEQIESRVLSYVRALRDGGELALVSGESTHYPAANDAELIKQAGRVELAYQDSRFEDVPTLFSGLLDAHRELADNRIGKLGLLQLFVGLIVVIGLIFVLRTLFSRLTKASAELEEMSFENERILGTVKEGLFLIDESGQISSVQSAATRAIFARVEPISGDFFAFIQPFVNEADLVDAYDYIALLLEGRGRQSLLRSLNPLQEVELSLEADENHPPKKKFISFDFSRSSEDTQKGLLVSVRDISKEVALRHELDDANSNNQERMHVLMGSIAANTGEEDMKSFYIHGFRLLQEANEILKDEDDTHFDNLEKLNAIAQKIHRLKGNASAMGVGLIETSCHHVESKIEELKATPGLDGKQILGLTVQLKQMLGELDFLQQLTRKLDFSISEQSIEQNSQTHSTQNSESSSVSNVSTKDLNKIQRFAIEVAERNNRLVSLDIYGFEEFPLEKAAAEEIESICIQLVRNSIVHGIEDTGLRSLQNKPSAGQIIVALREKNREWLTLTIRDDGAGLNLKNIRARAIRMGLVSFDAAARLTAGGIVRLLFKPGFTTKDEVDLDGGRGFGLDVVKTAVSGLGGKIGVKSRKTKFCEVTIKLPKSLLSEKNVA